MTEILNFSNGVDQFEAQSAVENADIKHEGIRQFHLRVQQRNGKKTVTSLQGLPTDTAFKELTKRYRGLFACMAKDVPDVIPGRNVVIMSGDQRKAVEQDLREHGYPLMTKAERAEAASAEANGTAAEDSEKPKKKIPSKKTETDEVLDVSDPEKKGKEKEEDAEDDQVAEKKKKPRKVRSDDKRKVKRKWVTVPGSKIQVHGF